MNNSNIGFRGSYFREKVPAQVGTPIINFAFVILIFANGTRIREIREI